jgi:predicted RNA-binding Zn-ribbon protein involved in translation (DUF1610 family)
MRFSSRTVRRVPAKIRTRPVRGKGDDAGRYYRCSYCGFICDAERDRLEGENALAGNDHQNVVTTSVPVESIPQSGGACVAVLGGDINFFHTAILSGSDGQPQVVYHTFEPTVNFGCPSCGTTNWKGK